jgi:hypothetical protein
MEKEFETLKASERKNKAAMDKLKNDLDSRDRYIQ